MNKQLTDEEWEDKAYLRFLPPHLQERYRESVTDPQLTHLVRQISLIDVRIKSLLENLDRQVLTTEQIEEDFRREFPHLKKDDIERIARFTQSYLPEGFIDHRTFQRLELLMDKMEAAQIDGRIRDADRAKKQLFESIRVGRRDGDVWDNIQAAMEQRRKLSEAEERRISENRHSLTLDQVVMLLGLTIKALKESVRKYVPDREIQQYILEDADREYTKQIGTGNHP